MPFFPKFIVPWYDEINYPDLDFRDLEIYTFYVMAAERKFLEQTKSQKKCLRNLDTMRYHLKEEVSFDNFYEKFIELGFINTIRSSDVEGDRFFMAHDDGYVILNNLVDDTESIEFSISTSKSDLLVKVKNIIEEVSTKKKTKNKGRAYVLTQGYDGLTYRSVGVAAVPLHITNYSKEAQIGIKSIIHDLNSNLPTGKLTIIRGEPGTGKTNLIRALISEVPHATFIIIPPNMVSQLGDPGIVPVLIRLKSEVSDKDSEHQTDEEKMNEKQDNKSHPIVFIVEDADTCLTNRGGDNMSSISSILNATDGILGDMLDLRIIATTNAAVSDFDQAILRPGRLSCNLEVGTLSASEANIVYQRLMEDPTVRYTEDSEEKILLASIYKKVKVLKQEIIKKDAEMASAMLESNGGSSDSSGRYVSGKSKKKIGFD